MNDVIRSLLNLQVLEFGEVKGKNVESQAAELRTKIPLPILAHYDRLRARGKKGLAAVRNQVCTPCHMRVPIGLVTMIMRGEDIQLCETCGRYLYMAEPEPESAAAPEEALKEGESAAAKPAKKRGRKPKVAKETAVLL
jgi:predicted  nucleic acid-binding Zn-ribbon protein